MECQVCGTWVQGKLLFLGAVTANYDLARVSRVVHGSSPLALKLNKCNLPFAGLLGCQSTIPTVLVAICNQTTRFNFLVMKYPNNFTSLLLIRCAGIHIIDADRNDMPSSPWPEPPTIALVVQSPANRSTNRPIRD